MHKYDSASEKIDPRIINQKVDLNLKEQKIAFRKTNSFENIEVPRYDINIHLNNPIQIHNQTWKGHIQGDISAYGIVGGPDMKSPLLIFHIDLLNKQTLKDITFFQCNIYKIKPDALYFVTETYHAVDSLDNTIGIVNNLDRGKYAIEIGFFLKDELNKDYPTFYKKRCNLEK